MRIQSSLLAIALAGCAVDSEPSSPDDLPQPADDLTPRVMRELHRMSPRDGIVQRAHIPAIDGLEHVKYRQTYRGVPVARGNVSVTVIDGTIRHVADGTIQGIDVDVVPRMSKDEAVARAVADFAHPDVASRAELVIDTEFERRVARTRPASTPLNADEVTRVPVRHVLVWQVLVGDGRESMAYVFDAQSGALRSKFAPASDATNTTAWASTEYHGAQMIDVVANDPDQCGKFATIDWKRGHSNFATYDSRVNFFSSAASFGDADPPTQDYTTGGSCDPRAGKANAQTAGVDAEFGLAVTWDMYKNVFGFPGWGGNGEQASVYVHWQENNAQYKIDPFGDHINLGDGNWQQSATPWATIDVVGHEFTHGVDSHVGSLGTFSTGNLISEGIADLGGVFANLYFGDNGFQNSASSITDTGNQDDFELFHDVLSGAGNESHVRFLDRPSLDGSPNSYFDTIGDLDPHQSSGPIRRAFYYIMKGASPHDDWRSHRAWHSNTPLLPWGMNGIGVAKTAKLYFHTFFGCLDDAQFDKARSCAEIMAILLFPTDASVVTAVDNAFGGVNVGDVASSYPNAPAAFLEQEPNDTPAQATTGLHWTASPAGFETLFKMDVVGFMPSAFGVDEYKFTAKCGRHLGALLSQPFAPDEFALQMRLFILDPATGNFRAMGNATDPSTTDPTLAIETSDFCTGTDEQTFLLKVVSNGDGGPFPYVVHLDAQ